jgi:hypothetical protein
MEPLLEGLMNSECNASASQNCSEGSVSSVGILSHLPAELRIIRLAKLNIQ